MNLAKSADNIGSFVATRLSGGGWAELADTAQIQPVNIDFIDYCNREGNAFALHDFLVDRLIILDNSELDLDKWRAENAEALIWARTVADQDYVPMSKAKNIEMERAVLTADAAVYTRNRLRNATKS